jgi:glycosyltransferase involved in cell wall biosynthesis
MYEGHSIGVVVPAYNEAGHIGGVIRSMPAYVDRIYLVDDASTDDTWEEALAAARSEADTPVETTVGTGSTAVSDGGTDALLERAELHPKVGRTLPIRHHENLGAGGAIKTGYMAARRDGVDITVTIDGDGQMDPEYMPKLLDPIVSGEADYAKGNRLLYREYRQEMPRFRFFGNSVLTFLTKIASGYWKTVDPQNGYTAISKEALDSIGVESIYEYYAYLNDILVRLNTQEMRVADVAMPARYGDEQSSIKYPTYIRKVSTMLLGDFLWRLKVKYLVLDFHPLALFYFFGAATAGLGGAGLAWAVYAKLANGNPLFVPGALSLLIFAVGSVCLLLAMVFDMQANADREVQIYE